MISTYFRHGCLAVLVGLLAFEALGETPTRVHTHVFDIDYGVAEAALPLDTVNLWYTTDNGQSWVEGVSDQDRQSPVSFQAPKEGLYGFFFVLKNAAGVSSDPPKSSTAPHLQVFVDATPPVVQLHSARQSLSLGQRTLQVRWTAIDAHLLPRPIRIEYKASTSDTWQAITANGLANTGRYDWRLPDSLSGDLDLRVVAVDQGDHETASESKMVEVMVVSSSGRKVGQEPTARNHERAVRISEENRSTSAATRQRADRYYSEGLTLRDRGDYRQGIARMREAVRLDPNMTAAFVEMAVMLYRIGEFDRSLSAFDIALQQQPTMRGALVGAAMVYRQKRDYDRASQNLRTVLRYNPNDAEAWMYLGDVAVFRGDDSAASEYYTRAKEIDPTATQVVEDAEHRLALMAEVSKPNRAGGGS